MDIYRKIEFGFVLVILFIGIFFLFNNPRMITGFFLYSGGEVHAPRDFISEDNITVYPDKIVLNIENYTLSRYSFSDSMVPVFDSNANGVEVKPQSPDELNIGDIITFHEGNKLIVHRIIKKGIDEEGLYFITKGDNNDIPDGKVRFNEIESKLVAIIY